MINRFELASVHVTFAIGAFFAFALVYVLQVVDNHLYYKLPHHKLDIRGVANYQQVKPEAQD